MTSTFSFGLCARVCISVTPKRTYIIANRIHEMGVRKLMLSTLVSLVAVRNKTNKLTI